MTRYVFEKFAGYDEVKAVGGERHLINSPLNPPQTSDMF